MEYIVNNHNVFTIVIVTFLVSAFLVPFVKKIAFHVKAIDYPGERKVHTVPTARLGGLAIFISFLLGYMLFGNRSVEMTSILIGGFVIIMVGFIDDINSVNYKYKLLGQILAASVVVFYGNIVLTNVSAFGIHLEFGIFSYPLTILVIVALTNAINLIDGIDGLSSGVSSIYFLTISVIAFIMNKLGGLDIIISLIMLGSTLGFLMHNFPPASIFVGDSGAMFLGYMISVIALLGFKNVTLSSLIIPLVILAIPIIDVLFSIIRRRLKHQSFAKPDKEHIHHQLLKLNLGNKKTVLIIYLVNIIFASVSVFYVLGNRNTAMIIYLILMILLIIFVLKTNVIIDHSKLNGKKNNVKGTKKKEKRLKNK